MADILHYEYVALDERGRRRKGMLEASSETDALEQALRAGLTPISFKPALKRPGPASGSIGQRDLAQLLINLSELLTAGTDIISALSVLGSKTGKPRLEAVCNRLTHLISDGASLERALTAVLPSRFEHVAALVSAGELAGDLPASLMRAGAMLEARDNLKGKLISSLSYPSFVFLSAAGAIFAIMFFVVPSLSGVVEDSPGDAGSALKNLIAVSEFLRAHAVPGGLFLGAIAVGLTTLGFLGALSPIIDRFLVDGPLRRDTRALVFGSFAVGLGDMLDGGAPVIDAMRLAARAVRSSLVRTRLEAAITQVEDGVSLSNAIASVPGFPRSIVTLTSIGESSGALGRMLIRAGKLEEATALRRIDTAGKIAGPLLIVIMGVVVGSLMATLLSSLSSIGESALH